MTYGHREALPERGERVAATHTLAAWRGLDPNRRLEMIEGALRPANDLVDAYPLAL